MLSIIIVAQITQLVNDDVHYYVVFFIVNDYINKNYKIESNLTSYK